MNNYLMYRQLLKCEFIPAEKVHPDTFKNAHRPFRMPMGAAKSRERHNAEKTPEKLAKNANKRMARFNQKAAALKAMGIDYECPVEHETPQPEAGQTDGEAATETSMET